MKLPVKLYNASGDTYIVDCVEAYDFHLLNGWSPEKIDIPVHPTPPKSPDMIDLEERVAILEDALNGSATLESVSILTKKIAELEKEVFIKKADK